VRSVRTRASDRSRAIYSLRLSERLRKLHKKSFSKKTEQVEKKKAGKMTVTNTVSQAYCFDEAVGAIVWVIFDKIGTEVWKEISLCLAIFSVFLLNRLLGTTIECLLRRECRVPPTPETTVFSKP